MFVYLQTLFTNVYFIFLSILQIILASTLLYKNNDGNLVKFN